MTAIPRPISDRSMTSATVRATALSVGLIGSGLALLRLGRHLQTTTPRGAR